MMKETRHFVYPTNENQEPAKRISKDGTTVNYRTYESSAAAILTLQDISIIEMSLERLAEMLPEQNEDTEELEWIDSAIKDGIKRIGDLHRALGAYSHNYDGDLEKPDSEKIDWHGADEEKPTLKAV